MASSIRLERVLLGVSLLALGTASAAQNAATATAPIATPAASATPTTAAAPATGVEEIVVTAQRRSQSLQDVPIAVSAFSGAQLARQNITNTTLLQQVLPNITFTKTNYTSSNFTIRGVGNQGVGTSVDSGVGVAFNEMPLVNPLLFETEYYDLDRIEVLRGPQGTLFGRNATSGVIDVITKKPDDHLGAGGEFEYGNYNSYKVTGDINVPLDAIGIGKDLGGFRIAGLYLKRDGFTDNLANNTQIDGRDLYSYRASLRLTPSSTTTIDLVGSFFKENDNRTRSQKQLCHNDPTGILGCLPDSLQAQPINANAFFANILTSSQFLALNGFGAGSNAFALNSLYGPNAYSNSTVPANLRQVYSQITPTYAASETIINARIEQKFDKATLTVIGGYTENFNNGREDYNSVVPSPINATSGPGPALAQLLLGKPLSTTLFQNGQSCVDQVSNTFVGYIGGQIYRCAPAPLQYDQANSNTQQYTIEAHVDTKFDGPVNFLFGGNYLHEKATVDYFVATTAGDYASSLLTGPTAPGATPTALGAPFFANNTPRYTLEAYAGFGEVYGKLTDNLKVTVGARYTVDRKESVDIFPQPLLPNLGPIAFGTQDVSNRLTFRTAKLTNKALTGRAVLDWKPELSFTDSTLIYASYSRGYKAGGINPAFDPNVVQANATFGPEHINAFEIGAKNRFKGGLFQANLSAFYYDYSGLQVARILNRTAFNDNTNATVYGVEGEFVITPTPAMLVNLTASYLHTRINDLSLSDVRDPSAGRNDVVIIKDATNAANCALIPTAAVPLANSVGFVNAVNAGINAADGAPPGAQLQPAVPVPATNTYGAFSVCSVLAGQVKAAGLPYQLLTLPNGSVTLPDGVPVNLNGKQLPNSPQVKISAGAQYTFGLPRDFTATLRGDVNLTGVQYGRDYNDNADRIAAYEIVNAQLTFNAPNEKSYVRLFVTNAFNSQAVTGLFVNDSTSALFTNVFTVEPRRFGVAIGSKF